ncbi:MAG TPA: hypothetical protein VHQ22_20260 [Terriglobales bacterium]|nr:hypothetical protein [Terriglobales bacterium]
MTRRHVILFTIPFFLVGIPAYAYGDPTGGTLFSVLLPMLAAVWAMFLIFANRIRRGISGLFGKLRRSKPEEQPHQQAGDETIPS